MSSFKTPATAMADDDKYHKRGGMRESTRNFYLALGLFVCVALLYTMTPSRTEPDAFGTITSTHRVGAGRPLRDLEVELEEIKPPGSLATGAEDDDAESDFEGDADKSDDENSGLSSDYPRYEARNRDQEKVVSANDQEDDIGVADETAAAEIEEEERIYDEATEGDIFEDQAAFDNAPIIQVLPESKVRKYSQVVLSHERYYRDHPSKLYVPTLKKNSHLTVEQFKRLFMDRSQPVIIPFESMRHLNFTTKAGWTLDELKQLYPNSQKAMYRYGALLKKDIDIGPAVSSLMENRKLRKTQEGKSYPRNTKFNLKSLAQLDLQTPPFIPPEFNMMLPSLWFASTSEATPLHSDCCDNWAMMVSGTKKWYVAPPTEARLLKPNCRGGLCWVKRLVHADHHARTAAEIRLRDNTQFISIDLPAGHVLYLPAGWFHHVEQEVPTVMINFWSKEGPQFLKYYDRLKRGLASSAAESFADFAAVAGTN